MNDVTAVILDALTPAPAGAGVAAALPAPPALIAAAAPHGTVAVAQRQRLAAAITALQTLPAYPHPIPLHSILSPSRYSVRRFNADPFTVMQRALQHTLDGVWQTMPAMTEAAAMPVRLDVREDDKAFHVVADLPGLSEKEVEVTFDDGLLTIRGEKKIEREQKDEKKDTWHVIERSSGSFARQITLSTASDSDKIEAKLDKGVLSITLPKTPPEQVAAKKIVIKSN